MLDHEIFTFHYASTLSLASPGSYLPMSNLHSTMLLLYQKFPKICGTFAVFTFHYASTLSLFLDVQDRRLIVFTFHYASTLSTLHMHDY